MILVQVITTIKINMKTILKYVILSAIRDKFFLGLFIAIISIFGVSNLMGFTAASEEALMQSVIFAGTTRWILVFGMIIFICFNINKSFENKEISFILSKNISREKFILSYWLAFNIIGFLLLFLFSLIFFLFCENNILGTLQWIFSVQLEIMIITMFSILASFILQSAVFSVFLSSGFYIISRLMGFFINMSLITGSNPVYNFFLKFSHLLSKAVSSLIPRLDLYGQTKWLIYEADFNVFKVIIIQSIIYILIMFFMAFYDFKKKQF